MAHDLRAWIRFLHDLAVDALAGRLAAVEPDRVCRRCWQHDRRKADAVYYAFKDAGACCRCGDVVGPADSVAVVSYR